MIAFGMLPGSASTVRVKISLLEHPAFLRARRLALEGERDLGRDRDVTADADEVDVDELVAGRVALDLAGERECVLLALELQRDQRVGAGLAVERVVEVVGGDVHRERLGVQPVDDGGQLALRGGTGRRCGSPGWSGARLSG